MELAQVVRGAAEHPLGSAGGDAAAGEPAERLLFFDLAERRFHGPAALGVVGPAGVGVEAGQRAGGRGVVGEVPAAGGVGGAAVVVAGDDRCEDPQPVGVAAGEVV